MQRPYYRPTQSNLKPVVIRGGRDEMNVNPAHRAGIQPGPKSRWSEANKNNNQDLTTTYYNTYDQPKAKYKAAENGGGGGAAVTYTQPETHKIVHIPPTNMKSNEDLSSSTTDHYHHRESFWRVLVDIISLGILAGGVLVSYFLATPYSRGFSCSNTSIKYPYLSDTIPTYAVLAISIGLPLVVMLISEIVKAIYFYRLKGERYRTHLEFNCCKPLKIPALVRNLYILVIIFAYGYLSTWMFVEISKNFLGRLRPHFIAVCQPSYNCSLVTATDQYFSFTSMGTNLTCLNSDTSSVREARRSFLSGHTAPMFYGCGFLIMYIHISWSWRHLGVLRHVVQTGLAILACYIGITRITDNQHHPDDVIASGIVGSLVAFATFRFVLNWHHYHPHFLPYLAPKDSTDRQNLRSEAYTRLASSSTQGDEYRRRVQNNF